MAANGAYGRKGRRQAAHRRRARDKRQWQWTVAIMPTTRASAWAAMAGQCPHANRKSAMRL
eukprot:7086408-Alexandrium_andersonii.AAC.2